MFETIEFDNLPLMLTYFVWAYVVITFAAFMCIFKYRRYNCHFIVQFIFSLVVDVAVCVGLWTFNDSLRRRDVNMENFDTEYSNEIVTWKLAMNIIQRSLDCCGTFGPDDYIYLQNMLMSCYNNITNCSN
ncbi:uncharacterized protein LOC119662316 [Teleopsis dalmanni]|uniref:uncharacterized protein LOC119662316 n=1 Tax=Teleopsis dalmanni TaxID=139649 RepID=UPI0018CD494B|nr:uncharacterized protein LOC119662316 [Teleopsis dalmanni]